MGLYIVKDWLIKLMPKLEPFQYTEDDQEYEFASVGEDLLPFLAKNQFKPQIRKHAPLPKKGLIKGEIEDKVAMIMNPSQTVINKDYVRVQLHILPKQANDFFYIPHLEEVAFYMHAN